MILQIETKKQGKRDFSQKMNRTNEIKLDCKINPTIRLLYLIDFKKESREEIIERSYKQVNIGNPAYTTDENDSIFLPKIMLEILICS